VLIYYVVDLKKLSVTHIMYVEWWDDSEKESEVMWNEAIGPEFEVLSLKIWGIIPKFDKKTKENHKKKKKNSTVRVAPETQTRPPPKKKKKRNPSTHPARG